MIDRRLRMDALFAFDNAVERLLELSPIEALPEQLATLRFLFEYEFDKLVSHEAIGAMSIECMARTLEAAERIAEVNAQRCRSSPATWRR
jgi:hypothetical protein